MKKNIIGGFIAIPKPIAKLTDLTLEDKFILGYLFTLQNGENVLQPRQKIIAEALGIPLITIKRRIKAMQATGWITKKKQWEIDNRINQYIIKI